MSVVPFRSHRDSGISHDELQLALSWEYRVARYHHCLQRVDPDGCWRIMKENGGWHVQEATAAADDPGVPFDALAAALDSICPVGAPVRGVGIADD